MLAAVGGEGAADGVAFLEAAVVVAADVAFVALVGLDPFALGHFVGLPRGGWGRGVNGLIPGSFPWRAERTPCPHPPTAFGGGPLPLPRGERGSSGRGVGAEALAEQDE